MLVQITGVVNQGVDSESADFVSQIDTAEYADVRSKTENYLAAQMTEMQENIKRSGVLLLSSECNRGLRSISHSASECQELVYLSLLDDKDNLGESEQVGVRQKLLRSYLSDLPTAARIAVIALLTPAVFDEVSVLAQIGIRQRFGDSCTVGWIDMGDRHIAMDKRDDGVSMTFTVNATVFLSFSEVVATVFGLGQAMVDLTGRYVLMSPAVSLKMAAVE